MRMNILLNLTYFIIGFVILAVCTQIRAEEDIFEQAKPSINDEFDWKLIKEILPNENSNAIISPFSIKLLMSILFEAAGVNTSTYHELSTVIPGKTNFTEIHNLYKTTLDSLSDLNGNYVLDIGTKIYIIESIEVQQKLGAILKHFYKTEINNRDFNDVSSLVDEINNWIANVTHNHVTDLVTPDNVQGATMLMVNALYFSGEWLKPFPLNQTRPSNFYINAKKQTSTEFMFQTGYFYFTYSRQLKSKIIRLPYKGEKYAMTIILPDAIDGLNELCKKINGDTLSASKRYLDQVEIRLSLPKFKFDFNAQLKTILQKIGISSIFTPHASLALLARNVVSDAPLQVSNIIQKSGISVHEKGSEAFAATEVILVNKFGGDTSQDFAADHPFIFLIEDETTGTMLFAGKVNNPEDFKL